MVLLFKSGSTSLFLVQKQFTSLCIFVTVLCTYVRPLALWEGCSGSWTLVQKGICHNFCMFLILFSLPVLLNLAVQSAFLVTTEQWADIFIENFWVVAVSSLLVRMYYFPPRMSFYIYVCWISFLGFFLSDSCLKLLCNSCLKFSTLYTWIQSLNVISGQFTPLC